jgi:hypothetical protein
MPCEGRDDPFVMCRPPPLHPVISLMGAPFKGCVFEVRVALYNEGHFCLIEGNKGTFSVHTYYVHGTFLGDFYATLCM